MSMYPWCGGDGDGDGDEEIEGYDPAPVDVCPRGGGHAYVLIYENTKVQILKCTACGHDSVGYFFKLPSPWGQINEPKVLTKHSK